MTPHPTPPTTTSAGPPPGSTSAVPPSSTRRTTSPASGPNRVDAIPIAARLRKQLKAIRPAAALPSTRVFTRCPTNEERRDNFKVASIALKDSNGCVADLHSLRSTLATNLARRGVSVHIAQRLLRHGDVNLTLRAYTRLSVDDLSAGLARLSESKTEAPGVELLRSAVQTRLRR